MIPTTRTQVERLRMEDLDAAMRELGQPPFLPGMSLARRRERLWAEIQKQRAHGFLDKPEARGLFPVFIAEPKALPRGIPYEKVAERTVFAAAQSGVHYSDLLNIVEATARGFGDIVNPAREAQQILARLNAIYGWGVRQHPDSTIEVYA